MNVQLNAASSPLNASLDEINPVNWFHYVVRSIDDCAPYVQNTMRASVLFVIANVAFFELSLAFCKLVNRGCNWVSPYKELSDRGKAARSFVLGSAFVCTLGIANHTLRTLLRIPLPLWQVVGIGLVTNIIYLFVAIKYHSR